MHRAHIQNGGYLESSPTRSFDFGRGDFTIIAMVETQLGGTIFANSSILVRIEAASGGQLGRVVFATENPDHGTVWIAESEPVHILDNKCHTIAGVRKGADLFILIDGIRVPANCHGSGVSPIDLNFSVPRTAVIGQVSTQFKPAELQFIGDVMNVSVWAGALENDNFVRAAFGRITGTEPNLRAFWSLDDSYHDASPNQNALTKNGPVSFEYCLKCVWSQIEGEYAFCEISNLDGHNPPDAIVVSLTKEIHVFPGSPALTMAVMANIREPKFPHGAIVTVIDPSGSTFTGNRNDDKCCVTFSDGQLWTFVLLNPNPGVWQIKVSAPAKTEFRLLFQTIKSDDVVKTCRKALAPIYAPVGASSPNVSQAAPQGIWDYVAATAVGALAGAAVAGLIVFTGGAALPALVAGVAVFGGVTPLAASKLLPHVNHADRDAAAREIGELAGFVVAVDQVVLMDANIDIDPATRAIFSGRSQLLYPQVNLTPFARRQVALINDDMSRENVHERLSEMVSGYVSSGGHGRPNYLMGRIKPGTIDVGEEVLALEGKAQITPEIVSGKIFHLLACWCGSDGGLGQAMVAAGAVAFFGYSQPVRMPELQFEGLWDDFCEPDITIDLSLLRGLSCQDAYREAMRVYQEKIDYFSRKSVRWAQRLAENRDALVCPSTSAAFGDPLARLRIDV